jgi:hypothetical protein
MDGTEEKGWKRRDGREGMEEKGRIGMDARVGETAPAFTMDTTAGRRSLDDYRGRTLVLAFFPLAFTGG